MLSASIIALWLSFKMLRTYVRNTYTHHLSEIFSTVVNEYTDWERTALHPINTRDATVAALSDAQFVAPLVQTGDAIYRVGPASPSASNAGPAGGPVAPIASSGGMGAILRTDGTGPFFYVFDYQTKEGDYPQEYLRTIKGTLTYFFPN
ncbi:uncharacterized protein LOC127748827 [Frankliniella occidentalis]|uniref:Uncharacterized protein LOC127748827 n=1 Tax=Frankliniella occidentalis TaxID=133901 RepID=A0A9C6U2C6_FRAOC|nr:uncharacterized protein LOC127748827 [Frankliniella occidentalis]